MTRVTSSTLIAAAFVSLACCSTTQAASLAEQLQGTIAAGVIQGGGSVGTLEVFVPRLLTLASQGVDFPVASTTPGFTYRYNPDLGLFERSPSLGPALLERADTVGKGVLTLGGSYLYGDLTEDNGKSIEGGLGHIAIFDPAVGGSFTPGTETFTRFSLLVNVFSFTATYGITQDWDVNLLVPLVWTSLDATSVVNGQQRGVARVQDDKVGPGDILVRTKYRFWSGEPLDLATGLILKLPSGSRDDFQGLGETTVEPILVGSRTFGIASFHANLGMEVNADERDRSRGRYGVGTAIQALDWLAVLVDVLGSSGLTSSTGEADLTIPNFAGSASDVRSRLTDPGLMLQQESSIEDVSVQGAGVNKRATVTLDIGRTDIVDVAAGFKFRLPGGVIGFASAIVPITSDGIRAQVVPTAGLSYSF